jgi:hypothetical protein
MIAFESAELSIRHSQNTRASRRRWQAHLPARSSILLGDRNRSQFRRTCNCSNCVTYGIPCAMARVLPYLVQLDVGRRVQEGRYGKT